MQTENAYRSRTDASNSKLLRADVENMSNVAIARAFRDECPGIGLVQALYMADLLVRTRKLVETRTKALK